MKIEQKALEVLHAITKKVAGDEKYAITLSHDRGLGSGTVEIAGLGHTHVGVDDGPPEERLAYFVDGLYSLLVEGRGLSFAGVDLDWPAAKEHFDRAREQYQALEGLPGVNTTFTLRMVFDPLGKRYNAGERTPELHAAMVSLV